ncbi:probable peptidyl-tRNA hydrolase 2 isoform X1 [Diabrotica virgifera virgifera]|uniref:peptidyl-tRNA hydrolase n=1 Tax=Diabrotica virgifera virgifera TaxID=50390 RepID=A0A6P7FPB1_DIAVI|nr:probable peptidyl-tRNA hydrolase 2 isoform X1 [Diabrotica virgifera virgifera]XP_050518437.1 probable peptidyl-tRNA hydrolase 2 isoform X1 [Diabrotica virgifera virgifera]
MFKSLISSLQPSKMVIILRTDINMGRGKLASQAAHAAVLLYQSSIESNNLHLKSWLATGQPKIVLKVETNCEEVLKDTYNKAKNLNLNTCLVRDAGRTQVDVACLTAVGIGPNKKSDIDEITSSFKLL